MPAPALPLGRTAHTPDDSASAALSRLSLRRPSGSILVDAPRAAPASSMAEIR